MSNMIMTAEALQPAQYAQLEQLGQQIEQLEIAIAESKAIEKKAKEFRVRMYQEMSAFHIEKWEMNSGTKITRVAPTVGDVSMEMQLDVDALTEAYPELVAKFMRPVPVQKKGRAGYVKITLPKEN